MDNKRIFITTIVLVFVLVVVVLVVIFRKGPSNNIPPANKITPTTEQTVPTTSATTPTVVISQVVPSPPLTITFNPDGPQQGLEYFEIDPEMEKVDLAIAQLAKVGHYEGKDFIMDYQPDRDKYVITISPSNKDAGEAELDSYLKSRGIPTRTSIRRLVIEYK